MELKKGTLHLITFLLTALSVSICFLFLFHTDEQGKPIIFKMAGEHAVDDNFHETETEAFAVLASIQNSEPPQVKYSNIICVTERKYHVLDFILIKESGSSEYVNGSEVTGIALQLLSFKSGEGEALPVSPMQEWSSAEETDGYIYYDKEEQQLLFNSRGIYRIEIRVRDERGRSNVVELKIPVED